MFLLLTPYHYWSDYISQLGVLFPLYGNIIQLFQTTNQPEIQTYHAG